MINRVLIRIKVLQITYAFYQNEGSSDLKTAEKEFLLSLQRSYDLYHYLLWLIPAITRLQQRLVDSRRHKYLPTEAELNPNTRLAENRFALQLADNTALKHHFLTSGYPCSNDESFIRQLLDQIMASDLYARYVENEDNSYEVDRTFWRAVFKKLLCGNPLVEDFLEDQCLYWNDDLDIVQTFVLKTIKRFEEQQGKDQPLLPMFKDEEDREFAVRLFRQSLLKGPELRTRIEKHIRNWESERVANMDLVIMQVALAEVFSFPSIPVSVTLNEYIDAAKRYSTPKSGIFINGILDAIVKELRTEKLIVKD